MKISVCLDLYIKHLKYEKNLSPNTVRAYEVDLESFLAFLAENNLDDPKDIDLSVFRAYLKSLDGLQYKHRTLIRKYSSFINFFKFLETNDLTDKQLSQLIAAPKRQTLIYNFLSTDEISRLFNVISGQDPISIRDRALFETLYSTGTRVSELSLIKVKDIELDKDEIVVFGKGRKERIVYINSQAQKWLQKYLAIRNTFLFIKKDQSYKSSEFLFLNKFGGPLSTRMIRKILKKYIKKAEINKNITPHGIRHSYATHLIEEGAGIREIQELLGHESIFTTQIYTHMNIKKLKKDFNSFHPRSK